MLYVSASSITITIVRISRTYYIIPIIIYYISHTITYSIRNNKHILYDFVIIFIYFREFLIIPYLLLLIIYNVNSDGICSR